MAKKKWKVPQDADLDESTQRLLRALRAAVITEFETLAAAGLNPYHLRFCALTAHIISMADMIGASTSGEDREEMREFIGEGGMTMLHEVSETAAEFAEKMDGRLN